jgi:hypothetical protein
MRDDEASARVATDGPRVVPDLDARASEFFTFRDLIECGETWARLAGSDSGFDNLPVQPESWQALSMLATILLDPIHRRFGPVALTFGFCSPALARAIRTNPQPRISPADDQHASCELDRRDKPICVHGGASCDFRVLGREDRIDEVGAWIVENLEFDALYYYGRDRALHLSWAPKGRRMVVRMRTVPESGRRMPAGRAHGVDGTKIFAREIDEELAASSPLQAAS